MSIADFNDVGLRLEGGALIDANLASSRAFTIKVFAAARSQRARDVNLVISYLDLRASTLRDLAMSRLWRSPLPLSYQTTVGGQGETANTAFVKNHLRRYHPPNVVACKLEDAIALIVCQHFRHTLRVAAGFYHQHAQR